MQFGTTYTPETQAAIDMAIGKPKEQPSMWAALAAYVTAPPKGKNILNTAPTQDHTGRNLAIGGGVLVAGGLLLYLALKK